MVEEPLQNLLRTAAPQVLGALVRRYGHFDLAKDPTQEALLAAAQQWPADGGPDHPRGWLVTVAGRRLTDLLRNEQARQRREETVARWRLTEDWVTPPADRSRCTGCYRPTARLPGRTPAGPVRAERGAGADGRALYGLLVRLSDNPMVRLNQAVAVAIADGPTAGLTLVDRLAGDPHLGGDHRLPAVRAHLLERAGETEAAYAAYRTAAGLTRSRPQQYYLNARAARLDDSVAVMTNPADEDRIADRAHLLPEELEAGSDDPQAQAEAILAESDERTAHPEGTRDASPQAPEYASGQRSTGAGLDLGGQLVEPSGDPG